jgi:uncharacterized protein YkwD
MKHWTRTLGMIAVAFGMSLVLSACDADDVLALLDGAPTSQAPAAEAAATATADASATAEDDQSEDVADPGKRAREFQCLRDGVKARAAADRRKAGNGAATADDAAEPARQRSRDAGSGDAGGRAADRSSSGAADDATQERSTSDKPKASGGGASTAGAHADVEQKIYDRLNAARREAGLDALTLVAKISRGARSWSCDMAASGNFRHADLGAAGVFGENIAWGQRSAAEVHTSWMDSPGHRDNRMSKRWSEYGVGVCANGDGRLYFTERFR